jgi:cytochrome c peroxidase
MTTACSTVTPRLRASRGAPSHFQFRVLATAASGPGRRRTCPLFCLLLTAVLASVTLGSSLTSATPEAKTSPVSDAGLVALGKKIFFDPSLSASGRMSCATCHNPQHAYGPPNGLAVQLGGAVLDRQAARAVPSLRYILNRTPVWSQPFVANLAERIVEGEEPPRGGFGWDGRFDSLHEQAAFPLLSPNEMANSSPEAVAARLKRAAYAKDFREVFGVDAFNDSGKAYSESLLAIERFELEDESLHPYTSKYDDYLDGKIALTPQELRGKALFDDPQRGNCAVCHPDRKGVDGSHPLFTDFQFEALGVPRNREILANATPTYFDEGVCGPLRTNLSAQSKYCGLFKTPTLRNVATRATFFHNGRFHTLKEVLRFYVQRDTDPKLWYPASDGGVATKFDDLPPPHRGNVDVVDRPLTSSEGAEPIWTQAEIDDVIAFLETLTDRDAQPAKPK